MDITHNTRVQLQSEGTTYHNDLVDFTEESMAMISQNFKRPRGRIQDPDPIAAQGATMPTPTFMFGAKRHIRLIEAFDFMWYYEIIGSSLPVQT